jgi:cytoskeletal protein RodZ
MSSTERITLTDMGKYASSEIPGLSSESLNKEQNSCRMKFSTGFVLVFLALILAVGVGLIVHFAENRKIECNFPENLSSSDSGALKGKKADAEVCKDMAKLNRNNICKYNL